MARATTCLLGNKEISVEEAIEIKENTATKDRKELKFLCSECGKQVRPHKAGGNMSAHFEHLMRNPDCELSDPAR